MSAHTLLLRLAGPMQSWGTQSRFSVRDTGLEPSKSGVIGLLCAALGRERDEPVGDLAQLTMGVRIDHEGTLAVDYHTVGGSHRLGERYGVAKADGGLGGTLVSRRHYLTDADFLVGLAGEDLALLRRLDRALVEPVWPLFLGRKAFVPGVPIALPPPAGGVREGTGLVTALAAEPWPRSGLTPSCEQPPRLRLVIEADGLAGAEVRLDQPSPDDAFRHRRFLPRRVRTDFCVPDVDVSLREDGDG